MDAISFVLGIKSSDLRSSQLKDLIYSNSEMNSDKHILKKIRLADNALLSAYVKAIYIDSDDNRITFCRSITSAGVSEYRINDKACSWKVYNQTLEKENILVKAKNFLVFQGDVEAVASQSPKDLTRLIEEISTSIDLKPEYDRLKLAQEKAQEESIHNFNKKRGVTGEMKFVKEQKLELEKFEKLTEKLAKTSCLHALWRLFHLEKTCDGLVEDIRVEKEAVTDVVNQQKKIETQNKNARKQHASSVKDCMVVEKKLKETQKELENIKPESLKLTEKSSHIEKKLKTSSLNLEQVESENDKISSNLKLREKDIKALEKKLKEFEKDIESRKGEGVGLDEDGLKEYDALKAQVRSKTFAEQEALQPLTRQMNLLNEKKIKVEENLSSFDGKIVTLREEEDTLVNRKDEVSGRFKIAQTECDSLRSEYQQAEKETRKLSQKETEVTEKLNETSEKLMQARMDLSESKKTKQFNETLENLKRLFPGVHGKLVDLCQPTQKKFETACQTVLGKNLDSIVVENFSVGKQCLEYFKEQRAGNATFIPLDTIQTKPIQEKYRSFAKGARLAIDCLQFDPAYEKALLFAASNTIIVDTSDIAKYINYERQQEVKCVCLDGTVFHKAGLITGGAVHGKDGGGKRWEEKEMDGLKKVREGLLNSLKEIQGLRRGGAGYNGVEGLRERFSRSEGEVKQFQADLKAMELRLKSISTELRHLNESKLAVRPELDGILEKIEGQQGEILELNEKIGGVEDEVFEDFLSRFDDVEGLKEFEFKMIQFDQESREERAAMKTQIAKLHSLLEFDRERKTDTIKRLEILKSQQEKDQTKFDLVQSQFDQIDQKVESIQTKIEKLTSSLAEKQTLVKEKADQLANFKKELKQFLKESDQKMKSVSIKEVQFDRLRSERVDLLKKCRLEEISIPLLEGSTELNDVSFEIDEDAMEEEEEDVNQSQAIKRNQSKALDSLQLDFSSLSRNEKENGAEEIDLDFVETIRQVSSDIEALAPNMKVIDKLDDVESKLKESAEEFESARKSAKQAKEDFNNIKEERYQLFHDAYKHISDRISEIYKQLTKSNTFPLGGSAYLSLEDSDEPYLDGVKYHAMPPMKRFRDMEQLSGGEKTVAALALLFAIHSYRPAPFFILDEVDAALDNTNVSKVAHYIQKKAVGTEEEASVQFIVISLKSTFYEKAQGLVGICRDQERNSSMVLTIDLEKFD